VTPPWEDPARIHPLTRECPLTCLELLLSIPAYHALQAGCPGPHPTVGHVVDLYDSKQISSLARVGVKRSLEVETCLASAGLIIRPSPPVPAPACEPEPPLPTGWSGAAQPRGMRTRLFIA
jgi:hypothetical protein